MGMASEMGESMSFFGWLDFSEEEQRQVRELMQLMSGRGTVDDLGIGTVRDAISNRLFPGTSTIQNRARYFLFVPWIYQRAESIRRVQLVARGEVYEKKLIEALRNGGDLEGLIGRQAGKDIKTLPSAIYWSGLAEYGIFLPAGLTLAQYGRAAAAGTPTQEDEGELNVRSRSYWHRDMPAPPADLFEFTEANFDLTREESDWLGERVLTTEMRTGPNLLSAYVRGLHKGEEISREPFWDQPLPQDTDTGIRELVRHAEAFSRAMYGASVLYNLLLSKQRHSADMGDSERSEWLRDAMDGWIRDCSSKAIQTWSADLGPFWKSVRLGSGSAGPTCRFVSAWCELVSSISSGNFNEMRASDLVRNRELDHKRDQARFNNPDRMKAWNGSSGLAPLKYRWNTVWGFLADLSDGLHGTQIRSTWIQDSVGVADA